MKINRPHLQIFGLYFAAFTWATNASEGIVRSSGSSCRECDISKGALQSTQTYYYNNSSSPQSLGRDLYPGSYNQGQQTPADFPEIRTWVSSTQTGPNSWTNILEVSTYALPVDIPPPGGLWEDAKYRDCKRKSIPSDIDRAENGVPAQESVLPGVVELSSDGGTSGQNDMELGALSSCLSCAVGDEARPGWFSFSVQLGGRGYVRSEIHYLGDLVANDMLSTSFLTPLHAVNNKYSADVTGTYASGTIVTRDPLTNLLLSTTTLSSSPTSGQANVRTFVVTPSDSSIPASTHQLVRVTNGRRVTDNQLVVPGNDGALYSGMQFVRSNASGTQTLGFYRLPGSSRSSSGELVGSFKTVDEKGTVKTIVCSAVTGGVQFETVAEDFTDPAKPDRSTSREYMVFGSGNNLRKVLRYESLTQTIGGIQARHPHAMVMIRTFWQTTSRIHLTVNVFGRPARMELGKLHCAMASPTAPMMLRLA